MRAILTHPYFWPYVRRGAEREVHDIGVGLLRLGHEPWVLTGAPSGRPRRRRVDALPVTYVPVPHPASVRGRALSAETAFALPAAVAGAVTRADVVHCFHYGDGYGVVQGRRARRGGPAVILKLTGSVRPERIAPLRVDDRMLRTAIDRADAVWCNSTWAADELAAFGRRPDVVPAGVDVARFRPGISRAAEPTVLMASAATDPRKRIVDLLGAWPAVLDAVPAAKLVLAGDAPEALLAELPDTVRGSVRLLGRRTDAELAGDYADAWLTAAPAVHEALGLCVLESLACGTPVVAASSGAHPELVLPGAGRLVEPCDPEQLAAGIVDQLRDAPDAATQQACVAAAAPYSWDLVLPRIVDGYRSLSGMR
jgi:glycosyltransferase involved in cell wall biosynthesis